MAHSHYVVDLYFDEDGQAGAPRREVLRMIAPDDAAAVLEAKRIDHWKKSTSFAVRSIHKPARSGDRAIYSSTTQ